MKISKTTIVIIIVALIVVFNGCSTYNSLVSQSETVDQAWAQVENVYQRRLDLIPNLVATVKGYAKHESETLQGVTNARAGIQPEQPAADNAAVNAATDELLSAADQAKNAQAGASTDEQSLKKFSAAQADLNRALSVYVNAVHEAYPDLKANENFKDLQVQLEGTENRIATERKAYTEVVRNYNVAVKRFPANIWAGIFGFSAKPQFQAEEGADKAPKVEF